MPKNAKKMYKKCINFIQKGAKNAVNIYIN